MKTLWREFYVYTGPVKCGLCFRLCANWAEASRCYDSHARRR